MEARQESSISDVLLNKSGTLLDGSCTEWLLPWLHIFGWSSRTSVLPSQSPPASLPCWLPYTLHQVHVSLKSWKKHRKWWPTWSTQCPGLPSTLGKVGYQLKLTKDLHETVPVFICQSNARILGDISHNLLEELTSVTESITLCIHCIYLCIDHI